MGEQFVGVASITGNRPRDVSSNDLIQLRQRVADLEFTLNNVLQEKKLQEEDFAQKRAKFREIFLEREEELLQDARGTREKRNRLEEELLGLNAAATVIESVKQQEIEEIKRKYTEELASFQKVMDEARVSATEETAMVYQIERERLLKLTEDMSLELENLRGQERKPNSAPETGSKILTGFTKTIRSLASPGASPTIAKDGKSPLETRMENENLEQSMQQAQHNAEMMKSVILPLEEEINELKSTNTKVIEENRLLHNRMEKMQHKVENLEKRKSPTDEVKDMSAVLESEKSSRKDLELYVGVLHKQKDVAQESVEKLETDLKDICELLEKEKTRHSSLMQTWNMANDQFLESQRLQMMDMRRLESVLTEEQQRQVQHLQKRDLKREEQEKRVQDLEDKMQQLDQEVEEDLRHKLIEESKPISIPLKSSSETVTREESNYPDSTNIRTSLLDINPDDLAEFDDNPFVATINMDDDSPMNRRIAEIETSAIIDNTTFCKPDSPNFSLTAAQEQAITSATPENEKIQQALESAKSPVDDHGSGMAGKRVVSETEWMRLQDEIRAARAQVGKPCDLCSNYEKQLQRIQDHEQEYKDKINSLKLQVEMEQEKSQREQKVREELEESLKNAAEDAQSQINILREKNTRSDDVLSQLQVQYSKSFSDVHNELVRLNASRDELYREVQELQRENESLSNKRSLHSSIMADEVFQLPTDIQGLQILCLKYREDLVTMRVNTEHDLEDKLGKLSFLGEQLQLEKHTKEAMEQTYQQELETCRKESVLHKVVNEEYEKEKQTRMDLEGALVNLQDLRQQTEMETGEQLATMKEQVTDLTISKAKLEKDVQEYKGKCRTLHTEMTKSMEVQKDFVQLSQSLQVQLENIRQTENEVRWEHEDDVDKCFNCKINFTSQKKKKINCKHCGKIHCPDCLPKSVKGGRRGRRMVVCHVCHTLLVNDSAPFFHKEAPPTT